MSKHDQLMIIMWQDQKFNGKYYLDIDAKVKEILCNLTLVTAWDIPIWT